MHVHHPILLLVLLIVRLTRLLSNEGLSMDLELLLCSVKIVIAMILNRSIVTAEGKSILITTFFHRVSMIMTLH